MRRVAICLLVTWVSSILLLYLVAVNRDNPVSPFYLFSALATMIVPLCYALCYGLWRALPVEER